MFGLLAVFSLNSSCLSTQYDESGRGTGILGMLTLLGALLTNPARYKYKTGITNKPSEH